MAKEEKKDEETPQEKTSFILITFEAPGSAKIAGLQTGEVSLNQVALAARELQNIADFEQWWGAYSIRMAQMEENAKQELQAKMIHEALMRSGGLKPN